MSGGQVVRVPRPAGDRPVRRQLADLPRTGGRGVEPSLAARFHAQVGYSVADVQIHSGPRVDPAARTLGARAFTLGRHVYLGDAGGSASTTQGRRTLLHELGHAVQSAPGTQAAPGARIRRAGPAQEAHAHAVADRLSHAVAPAGATGTAGAPGASGAPQVSAEVLLGLEMLYAQIAATHVEDLLDGSAPHTAVSGAAAAIDHLGTLSLDDLVDTVVTLDRRGRLEEVTGALPVGDRSLLAAAAFTTLFLSTRGRSSPSWGIVAARVVASLPEPQRMELLEKVLQASGRGDEIPALREGLSALAESEEFRAAEPEEEVEEGTPPTTLMAGVTIGPWNPGGQPIPFYLGNAAHVAIAAFYAGLHPTDVAFYNFSPVSSIVAAARRAGISLGAATATQEQLGMHPDIANVTLRHLYEIKPTRLQSLGVTEAALYVAALTAAGLPMRLGPSRARGTSGTVPAPGGWYTFTSPVPGVITYRYRQPPRRRVRVRVPSRSPAPARSKSLRQIAAEFTGLSGIALTIYLIISEGSRLIPVRNLVPVP